MGSGLPLVLWNNKLIMPSIKYSSLFMLEVMAVLLSLPLRSFSGFRGDDMPSGVEASGSCISRGSINEAGKRSTPSPSGLPFSFSVLRLLLVATVAVSTSLAITSLQCFDNASITLRMCLPHALFFIFLIKIATVEALISLTKWLWWPSMSP